MANFLQTMIKATGNEDAIIASSGNNDADVTDYIDTGSYALNALLSGSIYGGFPGGSISSLAGEPATGKTYFALNVARQFLIDNKDSAVCYFDTEKAIRNEMLEERDIDINRFAIIPVNTVQAVRTQAMKMMSKYAEIPEKERPKMMFILDSLGMLSTDKEMADVEEGSDKRDMTRAQLLRGMFRVLTVKLGKLKIPMIFTNHVYEVPGAYVPTKKMGGGQGPEYAASTIIFLSKKKAREGDKETGSEVVGNILTATLNKGRLTIANKKIETLLNYQTGLDRYYGLLDLAEKFGIFKKVAKQYQLPDGTKAFESVIKKNPEKYFTKAVLDEIDAKCKDEFKYGKTKLTNVKEEE